MIKQILLFVIAFSFIQILNAQEWINIHPLSIENAPTGVLIDSNDELYFISQGVGLFDISSGNHTQLSDRPENSDLTTVQIENETIWVGGYGGGGQFSSNGWENYNTNDLQGNAIYDLDITNGVIWAAMENEGANYYDGNNWNLYNNNDGILGDWHTCIAQNSNNDVFLGSNDWSTGDVYLNKFDGLVWTNILVPDLDEISSIFVDSQDNIWVAGIGLLKYDGISWTNYSSPEIDRSVSCIFENKEQVIYFGMVNGNVGYLDGENPTLLPSPDTFGFKGRSNGISMDSEGILYFCMGPTNLVSTSEYGIYNYSEEITSVADEDFKRNITISPNPSSDLLSIKWSGNSDCNIKIFNAFGSLVSQKCMNKNINQIDISSFYNGVYIVQFDIGGASFSERIVKY